MRSARDLLRLLLAFAAAAPVAAQELPGDPRLQEAFVAWDRGAYHDALAGYLAVLAAPDGEAHLEEIALLTGELYEVDELAADGRSALRVGAGGRWVTYEAQERGGTVTRVVDLEDGGRTVAVLDGAGAAVTSGGRVAYVHVGEGGSRELRMRALSGGAERTVDLQGLSPGATATSVAGAVVAPSDGEVFYVLAGPDAGTAGTEILRVVDGEVTVLSTGEGRKSGILAPAGGRYLVFGSSPVTAGGGRGGGPGGGGAPAEVVVLDLESGARGAAVRYPGRTGATLSADGSALAFAGRDGEAHVVEVLRLSPAGLPAGPAVVVRTPMEVSSPALSPSGRTVAFQGRPLHDWEIFAAPAEEGGKLRQITNEIQHDVLPRFVDEGTVLALKGEARHRRSYLYDVETGEGTKLFHNNTVRTIAPEYEWQVTTDGRKVLVVADRDGDTISPERGVYVVHLDRKVGVEAVRRRLEENLAAELDLRERGARSFAPIQGEVRGVTERVDVARIHQYAKALYEMGSKFITQPGNALAIAYLEATLRAWGYEPELQWFEPRPGIRSANVIARLPGTTDPDLVYVASSHFDSVERGPGADDNSSGTTALLEAARVLKDHPRAATVEFAFFTGEEVGLLGSREYVRRAIAGGKRIVGALNNDMIGWTRHHRLDNTIRYSNAGIRDIQHGAAILFSDLVTYDAHYYRSTDAAAYYEAYGDIVGGIGSYPVLGNPHYHQATDRLETIDHRLVAEVSRVTVATLMLLASSPARLAGLEVAPAGGGGVGGAVELSWDPSPERGVTGYRVAWTSAAGEREVREVARDAEGQQAARPSVRLEGVAAGSTVSLKAVNARGLESWDWAHATVPE